MGTGKGHKILNKQMPPRTLEQVADLLDTAIVIRRLVWDKKATVWQVTLKKISIRPDSPESRSWKWATVKSKNVNTAIILLAKKISFSIVRKGPHLKRWPSTEGVWLGEVIAGDLYLRTSEG